MKENILQLLEELGIEYREVAHPAVFTVEESNKYLQDKVPVKNLLLEDTKTRQKILVIMPGEQKLDMKILATKLGYKKFQFAKPEVLQQSFGVAPGAVSIFGLLHPGSKNVEVAVEKSLLQANELGFHPNDNTETIFIPGSAIKKILQSTQHHYKVVDLS